MICKKKLNEAMDRLGYSEANSGTEFTRAGVAMVEANRRAMMCKDIYPALAKAAGTTPTRVERCMRHATERAMRSPMWEHEWRELGGWNHPTNSEVLRRLARECIAD